MTHWIYNRGRQSVGWWCPACHYGESEQHPTAGLFRRKGNHLCAVEAIAEVERILGLVSS